MYKIQNTFTVAKRKSPPEKKKKKQPRTVLEIQTVGHLKKQWDIFLFKKYCVCNLNIGVHSYNINYKGIDINYKMAQILNTVSYTYTNIALLSRAYH